MSDRYIFLKQLCNKAGDFALNHFHNLSKLKVEFKGVQNMLSLADTETEQLIRNEIKSHYPDDALMGEEYGIERPDNDSGYIWIIDPIDGTNCFLNGLPNWCVSIAVAKGSELIGGAIYDPCCGELFHAYQGQGAWINDARIEPRPGLSVQTSFFCLGFKDSIKATYLEIAERVIKKQGNPYRNGSGALMAVYAAAYRAAGFYEAHINSWDVAAALAIGKESGCFVCDYLNPQSLLEGGRVLVCAKPLESEVKEIVGW